MSVIEEHKEKRRALGRGLDSLLPSGPRLATASAPPPAVMPPPIVPGAAIPVPEVAEMRSARPADDAVHQIALDLIDQARNLIDSIKCGIMSAKRAPKITIDGPHIARLAAKPAGVIFIGPIFPDVDSLRAQMRFVRIA